MRYRWLLLFLLGTASVAQAQNEYFNSENFWKNVRLADSDAKASSPGYNVIVATNRRIAPGVLRFALEEREPGRIKYFQVFYEDTVFYIRPLPSLGASLDVAARNPDVFKKPWLVYAEGFGKVFTSGIDRALRLARQHDVQVLYLDYPSFNSKKGMLRNYGFVVYNARVAHADFAPVLDSFYRYRQEGLTGNGPVSLFFHSMGNYILQEWLKNDALKIANREPWAANLILNAPCVPQQKHRKWLGKARLAQRVYVHYNPRDRTLNGAHLLSLRRMLGERPRRPLCSTAVYVNFHPLADRRHSNFTRLIDHPPPIERAILYYSQVFRGEEAPLGDTLYFRNPSVYRGIGYDFLPVPENEQADRIEPVTKSDRQAEARQP